MFIFPVCMFPWGFVRSSSSSSWLLIANRVPLIVVMLTWWVTACWEITLTARASSDSSLLYPSDLVSGQSDASYLSLLFVFPLCPKRSKVTTTPMCGSQSVGGYEGAAAAPLVATGSIAVQSCRCFLLHTSSLTFDLSSPPLFLLMKPFSSWRMTTGDFFFATFSSAPTSFSSQRAN